MSWITNLFAKHWRNIHLLAIVLLSAVLIITPSGVGPTVNQIVFSMFYWPFAEVKNSVTELVSVATSGVLALLVIWLGVMPDAFHRAALVIFRQFQF